MNSLSISVLGASSRRRSEDNSLRNRAYRQIKEKIICAELPPASLLDEEQLATELKLGRTPIRQALQWLALENLVVILPRRGTMVADVNMSDLQKIYEMRIELEPYAARLAAERATEKQIASMETLFAESEPILASGDHHQLIRIDHRAHQLLAEAAHNEFLAESLERLYSHGLRLWYVNLHRISRLRQEVEEHRDVVAAIKARDGQRAETIMRKHVADFHREQMASAR